MHRKLFVVSALIAGIGCGVVSGAEEKSVARQVVDSHDICQGWSFFREDVKLSATNAVSVPVEAGVAFDDAAWCLVSLPHTVRLDPPTIGNRYFMGGCWYRRVMLVEPAWAGRRVSLQIDGAMQKTEIWVNGAKTGTHLGGYLPFVIDLTPHLAGHDRVTVALHVDNNASEEFPPGKNTVDFPYFGGLYRPVQLIVTDPVHVSNEVEADRVAGGGVFVRCESADEKKAVALVQTDVKNDGGKAANVSVEHVLLSPDGREVARETIPSRPVDAGAYEKYASTLTVAKPQLWSPDNPWLYTLVSTVKKDNAVCDVKRTCCGLRWLEVTDDGFFLNGKKIMLRGANRHMSFPWLGNAGSDNLQYRDIRLLKEAGFNYVRLCHYPQSTGTMDACDELGVMAIVCTPGWQFFGKNESFSREAKQNIRRMVRWHRNHPSAVLWEVSLNETGGCWGLFEECSNLAKEEYPGGQLLTSGDTQGCKHVNFYDVPYTGWSGFYNRPQNSSKHKKGLHREYGDYEFGGSGSSTRVLRGAGEEWLMLQAWNFQWAHNKNLDWSWTIGDSIWAGIDSPSTFDRLQVTETGIIQGGRGSWWGPLDYYRLPKFSYYFYESQRDPALKSDKYDSGPMVRIAGYWTPRSSPAKVVVYSNCGEVELFLNGKSIGKRAPDSGPDSNYGVYVAQADPMYWTKNLDADTDTKIAEAKAAPGNTKSSGRNPGRNIFDGGNCRHLDHAPFTFIPVKYEPGELKAVAYIAGQAVGMHILRTPGKPDALRLRAATLGKPLNADGADALFVYAEVVDAAGEIVPDNSPDVTFQAEGKGRLIMPQKIRAEAGIAPMLVQSTTTAGDIVVTATADGLTTATLGLRSEHKHPSASTVLCAEPVMSQMPWTDTTGRFISAHEGGISRFGETYYWYGSCYRGNPSGRYGRDGRKLANGFNVYSSPDLLHWKSEGVCLAVPATGWGSEGTMHRPNVLYNESTKKYVMWFFHFVKYPDVLLTVATAEKPTGPFQIVGQRASGEEHGWAQDLGAFKDDDGKAYIVYDDGHRNLRVDLLTDDYLSSTRKSVIALKAPAYEGAAMIKCNGKYIVAGSGVAGWGSTETHYAVANAPLGPYSEKKQMSEQKTWGSQISNFFYDFEGQKVYAICDRWWCNADNRATRDLDQSAYYFLPVRFDAETGAAGFVYQERLEAGRSP